MRISDLPYPVKRKIMNAPITSGIHHIGLTVSRLEESAQFFTSLLGWREVRRNDEYPAVYVSDGKIMVTLWAAKELSFVGFDRKKNIGLHHVAFQVGSESDLNAIHDRLLSHGMEIEFAPEKIGQGPAKHMMCYEPSGIRVEFTWPGN
jgi:catechol 2,3-dioxygenase-like lactoylglutathione lyase family enzyme